MKNEEILARKLTTFVNNFTPSNWSQPIKETNAIVSFSTPDLQGILNIDFERHSSQMIINSNLCPNIKYPCQVEALKNYFKELL